MPQRISLIKVNSIDTGDKRSSGAITLPGKTQRTLINIVVHG